MGLDGKKTKLKAADITKIDFVPAGAQQGSRISLFKSADGDQNKGVFVKIADAIAKALSGFQIMPMDDEEASDFNEELAEQKVENAMCEMWDYTYALREAIKSILCSSEIDKIGLVRGSLDQFVTAMETAVSSWANGKKVAKTGKKISADRMGKLKNMHKALTDLIAEADASEETDKGANGSQVVKATDNIKPNKAEDSEGSERNMAENKGLEVKITKAAIAALPQDMQDYIASLEAKVVEKVAPVKVKDDVEDIYKGLPEAVVKILKDTQIQNKELATQIAKMADDKLTAEYVAKAAQFDQLGIKSEEFGIVLKSIATISPEAYIKIEAVLKAANEAIAKGGLFNELGSSSSGSTAVTKDEAWAQIETLAAARVTKGDDKTQAQAIESVMKTVEGHKLYAIYTGKA